MTDIASHLFGVSSDDEFLFPAPSLADQAVRSVVVKRLQDGNEAIIFLQDKLGGEIAISKTDRSPELSFDITFAQLKLSRKSFIDVVSYGILEIQTMDFHGSYRSAVHNLRDALRLHENDFADALKRNPRWAGERIEGPNIANVFKRTFYQMMLKFRIGSQKDCRGCVLALPESVWDSWQRHLGAPELKVRDDENFELCKPGHKIPAIPSAWVFVFDIASATENSPNPIIIRKRIATDADSMAHFTLNVAPEMAVGQGAINIVSDRIKLRLSRFWPDVWVLPSSSNQGS